MVLTCGLVVSTLASAQSSDKSTQAGEIIIGCKYLTASSKQTSDLIRKTMGSPNVFYDAFEIGKKVGKCVGLTLGARYERDISYTVALKLVGTECSLRRIPQEVDLGLLVLTVIRYLDNNPKRLHDEFISVAIDALKEAWPCN
jgi:hypothetical protein